jgi:hypothetical protein
MNNKTLDELVAYRRKMKKKLAMYKHELAGIEQAITHEIEELGLHEYLKVDWTKLERSL